MFFLPISDDMVRRAQTVDLGRIFVATSIRNISSIDNRQIWRMVSMSCGDNLAINLGIILVTRSEMLTEVVGWSDVEGIGEVMQKILSQFT